MQCISCGKDIPFIAKVCPYCHRDTKASSDVQTATVFLAAAGAGIGYLFYGLIGALLGAMLVGVFGGAVLLVRAQARSGNQAARVEVVPERDNGTESPITIVKTGSDAGSAPRGQESTQAKRLLTLEELRRKGLITADEYAKKRHQILDDV